MADQQGISINQLALYALTKEIKEMQTYNQLEKYWRKKEDIKIIDDFEKLLLNVKEKITGILFLIGINSDTTTAQTIDRLSH